MRLAAAMASVFFLDGCARPAPGRLTLSVAASLQDAIQDAVRAYPAAQIDVNYGGSGALARQIANGAPVDIFLSAAPKPMDDLAARGLLLEGTRRDLVRNEIVLVGPAVRSWEDLTSPAVKLIALGDPGSVPAGDYGRQVLVHLGLWDRVQSKLVLAKDVRQVLSYVTTGNADAGIVYQTDAGRGAGIVAPPGSHAPVVYPIAVVKSTRSPAAARAFVNYLAGPARSTFENRGFRPATP